MQILKSKDIRIKMAWLIICALSLLILITYFLCGVYTFKTLFVCLMIIGILILTVWIICFLLIKLERQFYHINEYGITLYKKDKLLFELKKDDITELKYIRFRWIILFQMGSGYLNLTYLCSSYKDKRYSMIFPTGKAIHSISISLKQAKEVAAILGANLIIK